MFNRPESPSATLHADAFLHGGATLFLNDGLRESHYRSNIDDPVSQSVSSLSTPQFQSSTSFSSTRNRQSSFNGTRPHNNLGSFFLDPVAPSYNGPDLYSQPLPTLNEGLSFDYDAPPLSRNPGHQAFGPSGMGGTGISTNVNPNSALTNTFGPVSSSQSHANGSNALANLHQSQMTQQHLLQHQAPSSQQAATNGVSSQYTIGGLQSLPSHNLGPVAERMSSAQLYSNPQPYSGNSTSIQSSNNNNSSTVNSSSGQGAQQEEISTIFVVGFPDDMQEREFQNMFTFSHGFEAATLKIPNKESSTYGTQSGLGGTSTNSLRSGGSGSFGSGFSSTYGGATDPYNLVTVNSGGVVLDSRDLPGGSATTAGWPGLSDDSFVTRPLGAGEQGLGLPSGSNAAPRKQIIGFAKFATRADAIAARDVLQSKRVDVEKGAVLKAEMAKKNLHTKRGVGSLSGGGGGGGLNSTMTSGGGQNSNNAGQHGGLNHIGPNGSSTAGILSLGPDGGVSGASGYSNIPLGMMMSNGSSASSNNFSLHGDLNGFPISHHERDAALIGLAVGHRPRHDLERERDFEADFDKDHEALNRMHGMTAFEAFPSASSISGSSTSSSSLPRRPHEHEEFGNAPTPIASGMNSVSSFTGGESLSLSSRTSWVREHAERSSITPSPSSSASRPKGTAMEGEHLQSEEGETTLIADQQSNSPHSHDESRPGSAHTDELRFSNRPPSSQGHSNNVGAQSEQQQQYLHRSFSPGHDDNQSAPYWPNDARSPVHSHGLPSVSSRGGSSSPPENAFSLSHRASTIFGQNQHASRNRGDVMLENADVSSLESRFAEFNFGGGGSHREPSPQSTSPGSGGTSGRPNAADQNPPINTLYVGNLPTTSASSETNVLLEENLRLAFSRCPGYRKLCFRQKSNGPMCFVEFEDVSYATRALNDMYGHTLNGLIKNGIRLSYSKNPLGVRSPSLANANGPNGSTLNNNGGYHGIHDPIRFSSSKSMFGSDGRGRQESVTDTRQSLASFGFDNVRSRQASVINDYIGPHTTEHGSASYGRGHEASSPPSRYFSPTPATTATAFSPILQHSNSNPISSGFGGYSLGTSTFSPFGNDNPSSSYMERSDSMSSGLLGNHAIHSNHGLDRGELGSSASTTTLYNMPPGLGENRSAHR